MLIQCLSDLGHHWFRWWIVAYSALSHYLYQCRCVANAKVLMKFQLKYEYLRGRKCTCKYCFKMLAILLGLQYDHVKSILVNKIIWLSKSMADTICRCIYEWLGRNKLTHWGRVSHICVSKLNIIGSDNGLLPGRRQVIIWTNAGILLIRSFGANFSEISSEARAFPFNKMHLKMSSAKWRSFCLGFNVLSCGVLIISTLVYDCWGNT